MSIEDMGGDPPCWLHLFEDEAEDDEAEAAGSAPQAPVPSARPPRYDASGPAESTTAEAESRPPTGASPTSGPSGGSRDDDRD